MQHSITSGPSSYFDFIALFQIPNNPLSAQLHLKGYTKVAGGVSLIDPEPEHLEISLIVDAALLRALLYASRLSLEDTSGSRRIRIRRLPGQIRRIVRRLRV
jgi:hypothetical protein